MLSQCEVEVHWDGMRYLPTLPLPAPPPHTHTHTHTGWKFLIRLQSLAKVSAAEVELTKSMTYQDYPMLTTVAAPCKLLSRTHIPPTSSRVLATTSDLPEVEIFCQNLVMTGDATSK